MISSKTLEKDRKALGEVNDCTVRAVAYATDTPYKMVHGLFASEGRRPKRGTNRAIQVAVLRRLGYKMVDVTGKYKAKTILTLEAEMPSRGRFAVYTSRHMLAIVAGKVMDYTQGRRHRVIQILRVVKHDVTVKEYPAEVRPRKKRVRGRRVRVQRIKRLEYLFRFES